MTKALSLPAVLVVSPERVAKDIVTAITKSKNVIYTPWFWRFIMLVIIHLPAFIFKKLKL
jgi:short-subunit dehydrogenase